MHRGDVHKTAKKTQRDRVIFLTPEAQAYTEECIKKYPEGLIFRTLRGAPRSLQNCTQSWRQWLFRWPKVVAHPDRTGDIFGARMIFCTFVNMLQKRCFRTDEEKVHARYLAFATEDRQVAAGVLGNSHMTILMTDVGPQGAVMVAESAIRSEERTPYSKKPAFRLAYGVHKIVPVARLNCAVGIWGMGAVETKEPFSYTPDVWIADFIDHNKDIDSIQAIAEALKNELEGVLQEPGRPFGFHLVGGPPDRPREFWEVTNTDPYGLTDRWLPWNHIEHGERWGLKRPDGAIRLIRGLNYVAATQGDLEQVTDRAIGHKPELRGVREGLRPRAEHLAACVRFICDFEKASKDEQLSVGGDVSYAAIGMDGVIHFKPPYEGVSRIG